MGRLRRRIRLIYVDYPAGQSHMTVVRRELPPSRGASRLGREIGRRIVSARALQSCPQRTAPDAAQDADRQDLKSSFTQFSRGSVALALGHRGPEEADEFAGDRRHASARGPAPKPAHRVYRSRPRYSITRSAWRRIVCGIVRPSALAVLRLMTSSNFVGCSTGRSPGFAPFRILST